MLEKLGIDETSLANHVDQGPRSSVIGTYRIVMYKLTKPPRNQTPPDSTNTLKTVQTSSVSRKGTKSKMCSIL